MLLGSANGGNILHISYLLSRAAILKDSHSTSQVIEHVKMFEFISTPIAITFHSNQGNSTDSRACARIMEVSVSIVADTSLITRGETLSAMFLTYLSRYFIWMWHVGSSAPALSRKDLWD